MAGGLLAAGAVCAQAPAERHEALLQPYSLDHSAVIDMAGPNEDSYAIMVAWPDGDPPPAGWPVLYVLDGEDNFATVALTSRRLARAGARSGIAPGLVVGIGAGPLERRVRDYTPAVPGYHIPTGKPAAGLLTGGADRFLDFVAHDVMRMIHRRWRVDEKQETIAGHSFGGLLAIHALLTRPALFDRAVAVSPSFWFGEEFLAREAATMHALPPLSLLLLTGEQEQGAAAAAKSFIKALPVSAGNHIDQIDLPGQSHGTTMLAALPQIINQAFAREKP